MTYMYDKTALLRELEELKRDFKDNKELLIKLSSECSQDSFKIAQISKQQANLQKRILHIESIIYPDIIA